LSGASCLGHSSRYPRVVFHYSPLLCPAKHNMKRQHYGTVYRGAHFFAWYSLSVHQADAFVPLFVLGVHVAKPQIAPHAVHRRRQIAWQFAGRPSRTFPVRELFVVNLVKHERALPILSLGAFDAWDPPVRVSRKLLAPSSLRLAAFERIAVLRLHSRRHVAPQRDGIHRRAFPESLQHRHLRR
jgi:hypothetical protein